MDYWGLLSSDGNKIHDSQELFGRLNDTIQNLDVR